MSTIRSWCQQVRHVMRKVTGLHDRNSGRGMVLALSRQAGLEPLEQRLMLSTTFLVTSTLDTIDPGDGVLTLREALVAASSEPGGDSIEFDAGLTGMTITLDPNLGQLEIDSDIQIIGLGRDMLTLRRDPSSIIDHRIIHTHAGTNVVISGLTLSDGRLNDQSSGGGAVYCEGNIEINNVMIRNNTSLGLAVGGGGVCAIGGLIVNDTLFQDNHCAHIGGGLYCSHADSTITNTQFVNNTGLYGAGAYFSNGTAVVNSTTFIDNDAHGSAGSVFCYFADIDFNDSTFSNNTSRALATFSCYGGQVTLDRCSITNNTNYDGYGGGIYCREAEMAVLNSVISDNHSSGETNSNGGGIYNRDGFMTVVNSTVSGNTSSVYGGGIYNTGGALAATNITVTGNIADYHGNYGEPGGGGVHVSSGQVTMNNSIVAGNFSGEGMMQTPDDVHGDFDPASSHCLIGVIDHATGLDVNNTLYGTGLIPLDAKLASLGSNGGPTLTHAILPGSPVVDAGNAGLAVDHVATPLITDQRGGEYDRIAGDGVDIGAYEVQQPGVPENLHAAEGDGEVLLSWTASTDPDVLYYKIFRSQTGGGPYRLAAAAFGGGGIIDRSVQNDITYYYAVSAVSIYGLESAMTPEVAATPHIPQPPAAPSDLTVTPYSSSQLYLEFLDHSDDETGFIVERKTGGGEFEQVAILDVEVNEYMDFDLNPLTTYTYRVASYNDAGQSIFTNEFAGTTYDAATASTYEAEDALLFGPTTGSFHHGYTGTGYADYLTDTGQAIEWTVDAPAAGEYELIFRYALGYGDRPLEIQVNGVVTEPSLSFPTTGGWKDWLTVTAIGLLNQGTNTIRATAIGYSGGNIDSLTVFATVAMPKEQPILQTTGDSELPAGLEMPAGFSTKVVTVINHPAQPSLQQLFIGQDEDDWFTVL